MKFLVLLLVLLTLASSASAAEPGSVRTFKVGGIEVSSILEAATSTDGITPEDTKMLVGASKEDLERFIPTGSVSGAVLVYVVRTEEGAVLVDTGFGRNIEAGLKALGLTPADIKKVLITHAHPDHIGGLTHDGARAYPNARVLISAKDYEWSEKARDAIAAYGDDFGTFEPSELGSDALAVAPGVGAIAAYGHTPGHTMFTVESEGERLLIWGDITHVSQIQFPRPDVAVTYDSDRAQAIATRKAVFAYAADNGIKVAGMHIVFPGVGTVTRSAEADGGFVLVGAE